MRGLPAVRVALWAAAATAAALALAIGLGYLRLDAPGPGPRVSTVSPLAGLGGPFELVNHRGERVSERSFLGKPTLYFFGFTHCPDVCPTTLYELTQRLAELGPDADRLNVVFVSVDPERDTPAQLARYLEAFDRRIVALTGAPEQIAAIARAYRVYYKRADLAGGGYNVDHSASVYVAGADGRVVMLLGYGEAPDNVLAKLRRVLAGGA